jgi:hypothetical protein
MISSPYQITRTMTEKREIDENGIYGDLKAVYCPGLHDKELFFRIFAQEYGQEICELQRAYGIEDVEWVLKNSQFFTEIKL